MQRLCHYHDNYTCWRVITVPLDVKTEARMNNYFIHMSPVRFGGGVMLMAQIQGLEHMALSVHLAIDCTLIHF